MENNVLANSSPNEQKKNNREHVSDGMLRFNRVNPIANVGYSALFIFLALLCILPVIFVIIISFTSESSIGKYGYSFFPHEWSTQAYEYVWSMKSIVLRSLLNSIFITFVGTAIGLILTSTMGYCLSRKSYRGRKFFTYYIFIPMLFHGGLLASYVVNTQILMLKDTYWVMILTTCCSSFYVIILRTFFTTTIPDELIESGKIDGASQLRIFIQLELTVKSALDIPAFTNRLKTIHSWYEKGYINPDAAVTESMGRTIAGVVQSGQGWFGAETVWSNARQKASYISRYDGPFLTTYSVRGAMTAISSYSEHQVEAMKLINLMNSNAEYRTIARYGIEGKHYVTVSEGIVQRTDLGNTNMSLSAYGQGSYALGPVEASAFESVPANPNQWTELVERYEKEAKVSPAMGFAFDVTPVYDQCVAMATIWEQYIAELRTGTSDPDVIIPELRAKLEAVGLNDVLAEAQRQLNEYKGK